LDFFVIIPHAFRGEYETAEDDWLEAEEFFNEY
jgi:hypothetical protein